MLPMPRVTLPRFNTVVPEIQIQRKLTQISLVVYEQLNLTSAIFYEGKLFYGRETSFAEGVFKISHLLHEAVARAS